MQRTNPLETLQPPGAPPTPAPPPAPPPPTPAPPATRVAVAELRGDAVVVDGAVERKSEILLAGQGVRALAGNVELSFGDGTRIDLAPGTVLGRVDLAPGRTVALERGELHASVARQPAGAPLRVVAPHVELSVLGTRFRVLADAERSAVLVSEGQVRVKGLVLGAGNLLEATREGNPRVRPLARLPKDDLELWLRAETVALKDGVVAWPDSSGRDRRAEQPDPARRPSWSGGRRPAVKFDGVDDALALPPGLEDLSRGLSIFVVLKPEPSGAIQQVFDFRDRAGAAGFLDFGGDATGAEWLYDVHDAAGVAKEAVKATGAVRPGVLQLVSIVHAGGTPGTPSPAALFVDGLAAASAPVSVPLRGLRDASTLGRVPNGGLFRGEIAEFVVYSRALGALERAQVEEHLRQKHLASR